MQLNSPINSKSIEALTSILIKSINDGEEIRVSKNLKRFSFSMEKLFSLSNQKFEDTLLNKEKNQNQNSFWTPDKNYSSAFYSILELYSKCIKTGIEANRVNIVLQLESSFSKLFKRYILKKNDITILEMYFNKQEELFIYCLKQNNSLSHSFGFKWYYNLTFDWLNTYGLFNLEFLEHFDKQIFKYIKFTIVNNDEKWLKAWIRWLHHGIGFMNLNKFDSYKLFGHSTIIEDTHLLDEKFENIHSRETYKDFKKLLEEKYDQLINIDSINKDEKDKEFSNAVKKALTKYLFMNTKHLVFASFSYSLYKNSFKLLFKMLNVNDTSKSEITMVGHEVFPQNINDITQLWIKENALYDKENWKFKFGDVFSENNYYERILNYIFFTRLKLNTEVTPSNLDNFSIDELMFLKEKAIELREKIDDFDSFESEIKEVNKELDFSKNKENIKTLLEGVKNTIDGKINSKIDNEPISEDLFNEVKNGFYSSLKDNSGYIKYILEQINNELFEFKSYDTSIKKFEFKDPTPRRFFVKETNTVVSYLGEQYATNFIQSVNTVFTKELLDHSSNIYLDDVDSTIEEIGVDNILILTTNHSEILLKMNNFKNTWEINTSKPYSIYPDGFYVYKKQTIPIYSFYTNTTDSKTFFVNKNSFLRWNEYIPSNETQNVKENIYISLNEETEEEKVLLYLYNTFKLVFTEQVKNYVIKE